MAHPDKFRRQAENCFRCLFWEGVVLMPEATKSYRSFAGNRILPQLQVLKSIYFFLLDGWSQIPLALLLVDCIHPL